MIKIENIEQSKPFIRFENLYKKALIEHQNNIEAICISSYNVKKNEVDSRFVNLKNIKGNEFIFFSNYESEKAKDFSSHSQVSGLFYWNSLNVQIRIKSLIKKSDNDFSDEHFKKRSYKKNALAISSMQSKKILSYEEVIKKYNNQLNKVPKYYKRPQYWGGYSLKPYFFEFWEGHPSRINRREAFELKDGEWQDFFLEP
jgi:pyridoxamine 5'-phosphate oxidase